MLDTGTRVRLKQAIREHLDSHGAREWDLVRQQFSDIPVATLWRYIAKVKAEPSPKAKLDEARAKIAETLANATADERRDAAAAAMPCIPSPAFIAKSGDEGMRHLDLLARFNGMWSDLDHIRRHALNNAGEIVDPELFTNSIEVGIKLVGAAIKTVNAVYDQRQMIGFFDSIVDEVAAENPETAGRIIARLRKLDEERGYSFGPSSLPFMSGKSQ
jgi:hypothetical protein